MNFRWSLLTSAATVLGFNPRIIRENLSRPRNRRRDVPSFAGKIEGVLRIARGMIGGGVERVETMILVLDFRSVRHRKTDFAEGADDVVGHLGEGMQFAKGAAASR